MNCEILEYATKVEGSPVVCNYDCGNCRIVKIERYFPRKKIESEKSKDVSLTKNNSLPSILELIEKTGKV